MGDVRGSIPIEGNIPITQRASIRNVTSLAIGQSKRVNSILTASVHPHAYALTAYLTRMYLPFVSECPFVHLQSNIYCSTVVQTPLPDLFLPLSCSILVPCLYVTLEGRVLLAEKARLRAGAQALTRSCAVHEKVKAEISRVVSSHVTESSH